MIIPRIHSTWKKRIDGIIQNFLEGFINISVGWKCTQKGIGIRLYDDIPNVQDELTATVFKKDNCNFIVHAKIIIASRETW